MILPLPVPDLYFESMTALVFVIDRDSSLRWTLDILARGAGWRTQAVPSVSALLGRRRTLAPSCLVLDVSHWDAEDFVPGSWPTDMPVICVMDVGDVALSVRAMKAGAVDVLTKPVGSMPLLEAVRLALNRSEVGLKWECELNEMRHCYASLSHREREVMALVTSGLLNKQVGRRLGISEVTVKSHRGRVMRKMKTPSFASLVMIAARLQLTQSERLVPFDLHPPLNQWRPDELEARRSGYLNP